MNDDYPTVGRDEWVRHALCRTHDPTMFDPDASSIDRARALTVCAKCAVWLPCLETGVKNRESGVWGRTVLSHGQARQPSRRNHPDSPPAVHPDL